MRITSSLIRLAVLTCVTISAVEVAEAQTNSRPSAVLAARNLQTQNCLSRRSAELPENLQMVLGMMLAQPERGDVLVPTNPQRPKIEQHVSHAKRQIQSWFTFDGVTPQEFRNELVPLAERVSNSDSLGTKVTLNGVEGYLRVSHNHIYLVFAPTLPASAGTNISVREFEPSELTSLDSLDRQRYEVSELSPDLLDFKSSEYGEDTALGLVRGKTLPRLSYKDPIAQRALQFLGSVVRDPIIVKLHWNIYDVGCGVYGDTTVTFRPPAGKEYVQRVSEGYIARFFGSKDGGLVAFCFSRYPDVFRKDRVYKQPPQGALVSDWFNR